MKARLGWFAASLILLAGSSFAQNDSLPWPKIVEAGTAFTVPTTGSGSATLYVAGPGGAIRREIRLGDELSFGADDLHNAGRYIAILSSGSSSQTAQFDVVASRKPASLSFLAKPSRIAVNLDKGISGVAYVFDTFHNLILDSVPVTFQLSSASGGSQAQTVQSREGVAWVKMNSAAKAGAAQFTASSASLHEARIVQQVPGDPCSIRMSAKPSGEKVLVQTDPVRDCNGNAVPDGTIVTFTQAFGGTQSTVDVPLKRGIAQTQMNAQRGAVISVAAGVVMGNEIRMGEVAK